MESTSTGIPPTKQAEQDAARILAQYWGDPKNIPIDPVVIARKLGIEVLNATLDANVFGALVKRSGDSPKILLNIADSPNRKRFSCAHEIGHYVKRRDSDPDTYEYVDLRDVLSSTGLNPDEIYANSFGACLLMPESEVRRLWNEGLSPIQMTVRFDVSREAMDYRLKNLGLA
jgi:Zn-dependent peptidase ImmA (M78 family)